MGSGDWDVGKPHLWPWHHDARQGSMPATLNLLIQSLQWATWVRCHCVQWLFHSIFHSTVPFHIPVQWLAVICFFFRPVNFRRKNIHVKKFSDRRRPNWTKIFYKLCVVGINWDRTACRRDGLWKGDSLLNALEATSIQGYMGSSNWESAGV